MAKFILRKSYDRLPALSVRGPTLRRSLRRVTVAITFATLWFFLIRGSHMVAFCRMLGFSDMAFGVMEAIPYLATLGQPLASLLIERTGLRKYQFIIFGLIHRLLWIVVPLVPLLLPIPSRWAVWAMLAIATTSWLISAISNPAWWSWMGDLIPKRIRGRFTATHNRVSKSAAIVAVIVLGVVFDAVTRQGAPETAADQRLLLWAAAVVLAIGGIFGAIDILLYLKVREILPSARRRPASEVAEPARTRFAVSRVVSLLPQVLPFISERLLQPLKDKAFRHYVAFASTITFSWTICYSFYWLNAMENLGFSKLATNVLILVLHLLCGVLTAKGWGRLIDRWGRRPVFFLSASGTVVGIIPMLLASPFTPTPQFLVGGINRLAGLVGSLAGRPELIWVTPQTPIGAYLIMAAGFILLGICGNAVFMVQSTVWMSFSDREGGSKYVAASFLFIGAGGFLGGLTGGALAEAFGFLRDSPIVFGPFLWNNWHPLFLLSMLGRIAAILWLIGMPDPGAGSPRDMMRAMGASFYNNISARLFLPFRIFRLGSTSRRNGRNR